MRDTERGNRRAYQNRLRAPIEMASFNEVEARVAYQIAIIIYRKHRPETASQMASFLLSHAQDLRACGFGGFSWSLVSMAKFLVFGGSTAEWRERYPQLGTGRAKHKQRIH